MSKFCSIVITHYANTPERSEIMRKSLTSLFTSLDYPSEVIVVDNGNVVEDSNHLLKLTTEGKIQHYVRNTGNMHFGYARNQGIKLADGDFICICDNDILYKPGWLTSCIDILEAYPDNKIYATPIYNVTHWTKKFWGGEQLELNGKIYRLNSRAGSNCFVIRRKDLEIIGRFRRHRIAGTKWTERAIELGYMAAVSPSLMIQDMGFRNGYNFKELIPIKKKLSSGEEIYFNQDEFKKKNPGLVFRSQR